MGQASIHSAGHHQGNRMPVKNSILRYTELVLLFFIVHRVECSQLWNLAPILRQLGGAGSLLFRWTLVRLAVPDIPVIAAGCHRACPLGRLSVHHRHRLVFLQRRNPLAAYRPDPVQHRAAQVPAERRPSSPYSLRAQIPYDLQIPSIGGVFFDRPSIVMGLPYH